MNRNLDVASQAHSGAWVIQTWLSFVLSVSVTFLGVWFLPVDVWVRASWPWFSLSKTVRDMHEAQRLVARIDEARVSKLIAEHDPLKPAL